jgi:hypothetical protein
MATDLVSRPSDKVEEHNGDIAVQLIGIGMLLETVRELLNLTKPSPTTNLGTKVCMSSGENASDRNTHCP